MFTPLYTPSFPSSGTKGLEQPMPVAWTSCLHVTILGPAGVQIFRVHDLLFWLYEVDSTDAELMMFRLKVDA